MRARLAAVLLSLIVASPPAPRSAGGERLDVYVNPLSYEEHVAPLAIGDPAPPLLVDRWLQGAPVTSFARDTVYVLEFWATWCQPCRKSLPEMDALARRYAGRALRVIGVAGAEQNGPEGVARFLEHVGLSFAIAYRRSGDAYSTWVRGARGVGLPWVFIVDRQGRIAWWGQPFYTEFERLVEAVLGNQHSIAREQRVRASRAAIDRQGWGLRRDADQALAAKDWQKASSLLGRLVQLDPQRYWWEVVEQIELMGTQIGRPDEARLLAKEAVRGTSWNNPHALAEIARFLLTAPRLDARDPVTALAAARRANDLTLGADADVRKILALADGAQPAPGPRFPLAIPFPDCGSTVLLPVQVNGQPARLFILDSGANSVALDQQFADSLGLKPIGSGAGSGAGGRFPYRQYARDSVVFAVGGLSMRSDHVISSDLSNQPGILGVSVGGVLGSDFFRAAVVEIDYDAHVVWLHRPADFAPAPDAHAVPLTFERRVPFVTARLVVPGPPPRERRLLVDCGSEDAVDDSLLLESRGPLHRVTGGVGSGHTYEVVFGKIDRFEMGPFTLTDLPSVAPGVCLIGGEVLRRFRVTFDYGHEQMWLAPARHLADRSPVDLSGLSLRLSTSGERLVVDEVQPGSAGARAGIVAADELVAVDGAAIRELGLRRVQAILTRPGARLRLSLDRRGAEREIMLVLPARESTPPANR